MQRWRSTTLAAVAVLAAAGLVLLGRGRAVRAASPVEGVDAEQRTVALAAPADLVEPAALARGDGTASASLRRPATPAHEAPAVIETAVEGVVLDAQGVSLGGVSVWLEVPGSDSIEGGLSRRGRASPEQVFEARAHWTTTDANGAFTFPGTHTADGGRLLAAVPSTLPTVVRATVDPQSARQVLRVTEAPRPWNE